MWGVLVDPCAMASSLTGLARSLIARIGTLGGGRFATDAR
jgi:hypothetical protein